MTSPIKSQKELLAKLNIETLNPMQLETQSVVDTHNHIVLLSPTGTGKTVAFLLPIIARLELELEQVQALIITPSRELAIQIEQVARNMGSGFKVNAFYGGRPFAKDRIELKQIPHLLIGTPGRLADHLRRGTVATNHIKILILDEFDKSLEIGFEDEMTEICDTLKKIEKRILTSATDGIQIPRFIDMASPKYLNYLGTKEIKLKLKRIVSPAKDKLETLGFALKHIGNKKGIIFCSFKQSIERVSEYLRDNGIEHGCFYGGLEQKDRERALIKFRNGTHQYLLATDLAARGIDVSEIDFILHYHLPLREEEFIHRNGRTARMHNDGTAYVLHWEDEVLPDFIDIENEEALNKAHDLKPTGWTTLFLSGGRKDKISKGDIAGFLMKKGGLSKEQVGLIELKHDCAFVAVATSIARQTIAQLDNERIKKRKIRLKRI